MVVIMLLGVVIMLVVNELFVGWINLKCYYDLCVKFNFEEN